MQNKIWGLANSCQSLCKTSIRSMTTCHPSSLFQAYSGINVFFSPTKGAQNILHWHKGDGVWGAMCHRDQVDPTSAPTPPGIKYPQSRRAFVFLNRGSKAFCTQRRDLSNNHSENFYFYVLHSAPPPTAGLFGLSGNNGLRGGFCMNISVLSAAWGPIGKPMEQLFLQ